MKNDGLVRSLSPDPDRAELKQIVSEAIDDAMVLLLEDMDLEPTLVNKANALVFTAGTRVADHILERKVED